MMRKLGGYKGKTILDAKRPFRLLSLNAEFHLAFHTEDKRLKVKYMNICLDQDMLKIVLLLQSKVFIL